MAKTQKQTITKTMKKQCPKTGSRACTKTAKKQKQPQHSNTFFIMSMSILAGALLFADLFMIIS